MAGSSSPSQDVLRRSRACVPCHERKVRCNAGHVGLPCTRCIKTGRTGQCGLVPIPDRSTALSKRKRAGQDEARNRREYTGSVQNSPSYPETSGDADVMENTVPLAPTNVPTFPLDRGESVRQSHSIAIPTTGDEAEQTTRADSDGHTVPEEDSQLEICREMSLWGTDTSSPTRVGQLDQGREVLEYHDGVSSVTILGEVFGQKHPKRLVRILLRDPDSAEQRGKSTFENANKELLRRRGAFNLPSRSTCEKFFRLYFERVYPYAPILDRRKFVHDYRTGTYSTFLVQCILANVTSHVSSELLSEAGYSDRFAAQRTFFSKAQLLYDMGTEKSQLHLLQGSLLLSALHFSFGLDKDYRFWLINAVRLATQMGLHRKQVAKQLDGPTAKLFRRIWWVLYNRDVLLVVSGVSNVRGLNDRHCDVAVLTDDDWEEEIDMDDARDLLPAITRLHKVYLVQNTKLALICARFIEIFKLPGVTPSKSACEDLERTISQWKRGLPPEMHTETVEEWSVETFWILVLRAMSYRLECVLYRTLRELYRAGGGEHLMHRALQKQQNAMLELDTIIDRIMLYDLVSSCPLSVTTCASTVLAMHVEIALSPFSTSSQRLTARTHIHNGLAYLRATSEYWDTSRWTLRMFEVIVARTALSLEVPEKADFDVTSMNPFMHGEAENHQDNDDEYEFNVNTNADFPLHDLFTATDGDYTSETMMGRNPEWLNELLGPTIAGFEEFQS